MKDWYFRRQLKCSNVCVGLYTTRISNFVFRRRRSWFPNRGGWTAPRKASWEIRARFLIHARTVAKRTSLWHNKYGSFRKTRVSGYNTSRK